MIQSHGAAYRRGLHDGIPIALGYLAVSFTLGIAAKVSGMTAPDATLMSLLNNTSAGEFAALGLIAAGAPYAEMAVDPAHHQPALFAHVLRPEPEDRARHPAVAAPGDGLTRSPTRFFAISSPCPAAWTHFTAWAPSRSPRPAGRSAPAWASSWATPCPGASCPRCRSRSTACFWRSSCRPRAKNRVIAGVVAVSMAASTLFSALPVLSRLSSGTRIILLTVLIAGAAAFLFPIPEEDSHAA